MDFQKLADLLFPGFSGDMSVLEQRYPARALAEGARVSRFSPSPTGLPHLGSLLACTISRAVSRKNGGVCYLRIEDTDTKRSVDKGVEKIISMLGDFGIEFDEGPTLSGDEKGDYGPYIQSRRIEIYHTCAKFLVAQGFAYPCFCSAEELTALRERQAAAKVPAVGYFGEWAVCRELDYDAISENIAAGRPWVLRLRSPGIEDAAAGKLDRLTDGIRGTMSFPPNIIDIVLLKSDGVPTYHFAHAVDDHFMRTTDCVRGEEWLATAPIHIQLFRVLGFKQPRYIHIAPLCKIDGTSKRKLSKREDPESGLLYYHEQGYDKEIVLEYLTGVANSAFEDWRRANPDLPLESYDFNMKNMSVSGAVFDLAKLADTAKNIISKMSAEEVLRRYSAWAARFNPGMYEVVSAESDRWLAIFNIDRENPKPRKDIANWAAVEGYFSYFLNEKCREEIKNAVLDSELWQAHGGGFSACCSDFAAVYSPVWDKNEWFGKVKEIAEKNGYAADNKLYKEAPDAYKGSVSDVAGFLRLAVTGRQNSPDLHSIMLILGEEEVKSRLQSV